MSSMLTTLSFVSDFHRLPYHSQVKLMNREQLQDAYINGIIDGMDIKDMMALLFDMINKDMDIYTDEELKEEVKNYYPHLLED